MTLAVYFEHIQKLFNRYYCEIVTIGWDLFRFKFIRRQIKYLSQDMYIYIYIYIYRKKNFRSKQLFNKHFDKNENNPETMFFRTH